MKPWSLIGLSLVFVEFATARLPDPAQVRELRTLSGRQYAALSSAISNFNEVPRADRPRSPAAERALTQVRRALKTLERAPGALPIHSRMTDDELARSLRVIRVADAFCNMPVVSFFIVRPSGGLKIEPHYSYDAVPTLDEVRARYPDCDVSAVHFSSSPAAAR